MVTNPRHRIVPADAHVVPPPFRSFAVRSEEPSHAARARAPYGRVHVVSTRFLPARALADLAAAGLARMTLREFADIDYAPVGLDELAALAPQAPDIVDAIAQALGVTGVLGDEPAVYRAAVAARIDYLGSLGAGFHNDVARHWPRCLFWNLALAVADVEFVMPHANVRVPLAPGDLLVFDQAMAHGLCRPRDAGQAVEDSFAAGADRRQVFLSGELPLADERWELLGSPWRPVEEHACRGALDLMVAEFDERSGTVKSLRAMKHCMRRDPAADGEG